MNKYIIALEDFIDEKGNKLKEIRVYISGMIGNEFQYMWEKMSNFGTEYEINSNKYYAKMYMHSFGSDIEVIYRIDPEAKEVLLKNLFSYGFYRKPGLKI